jgi:hypothetical protein
MSLFEIASREKFRFMTNKGSLTVEDLWDLPLRGSISLDSIAKGLNRQIREAGEESFVDTISPAQSALTLKFELVKYVIRVRLDEAKAAQDKVVKAQKVEKIKEILAKKEDNKLESLNEDELKKMLTDLAA